MLFWTLVAMALLAQGLSPNKCASYNTGLGSLFSDKWMLNGLCKDHCLGFAYAITSGNQCWCSNYEPGDTVDIGECNQGCPGIDLENCGGKDSFGYVEVGGSPSGTLFLSQQATTDPSTKSTSPKQTLASVSPVVTQQPLVIVVTLVVQLVVTETNQQTTTVGTTIGTTQVTMLVSTLVELMEPSSSSDTSSSESSSLSSSSSSTSSTSSSSRNPTTIVLVMTVDGSPTVVTEFITASPTSIANDTSPSSTETYATSSPLAVTKLADHKSFFDSAGKVAGTFTAVGVVVLGLGALLLWCCCCHRRSPTDDDDYTDEERSVHSEQEFTKGGLGTFGLVPPPSYSKNNAVTSQQTVRSNSFSGMLLMFTGDNDQVIRSQSRKKLMPTSDNEDDEILAPPQPNLDSRLDPLTMFLGQNFLQKLLNDDVDYSRRVLRVANPDASIHALEATDANAL